MGGKGGSVQQAPDYTPVAQSSIEAAQMSQQTAREQLNWAKEQYADQAPRTQAFMDDMTKNSDAQTAMAEKDRARYEQMYQPTEDKFVQTANNWNTPERREQQAGAAMQDVNTQYEAARANATASLESFGVDPSQTRYGALDLGTRISQAAAQASAGTQSRANTEATGLALQGEAINIGKGYAGQVASSYAGATSAGGAGVNAGLQTSSTYGNLMGTGVQYAGIATGNRQAATGALNGTSSANLGITNANNAANAQSGQAVGSMVGGVAALATIGVAI